MVEIDTLIAKNLETARSVHQKSGDFAKEALVLDTQGNFYQKIAKIAEAKQSMEAALRLREEHLQGEQRDRDCAASFISLAKLYAKLADHEEALKYYEKAKAAYICGFGEGHPKILPAYEGIVHERVRCCGRAIATG